jgi:putative redox protein
MRAMAVEMRLTYTGELHTELVHGPSGARLETDAPTDNRGRGQAFSPTDLVGAALLSCAITTMAIRGPGEGAPLTAARGRVEKHMSNGGPRRIARLVLEMELPAELDAAQRRALEAIAHGCPVARSLDPSIEQVLRFAYTL